MNRRLYRSRREEMISGVAGGVAEYLDLDPSIVRVVWAVLALITGGVFFIVYVVMWIVVPQAPEGPEMAEAGGADSAGSAPSAGWVPPSGWAAQSGHRARRHSGGGSWVFGLILIGVGIYFLAREYLPDIDVDRLWPLGLVVLGLLFMVVAFRRPD